MKDVWEILFDHYDEEEHDIVTESQVVKADEAEVAGYCEKMSDACSFMSCGYVPMNFRYRKFVPGGMSSLRKIPTRFLVTVSERGNGYTEVEIFSVDGDVEELVWKNRGEFYAARFIAAPEEGETQEEFRSRVLRIGKEKIAEKFAESSKVG